MTALSPSELLDELEVAALLRTTRQALKSRRRRGTAPPAVRVGGRHPWKYPRQQFEKWLAERPVSACREGDLHTAEADGADAQLRD